MLVLELKNITFSVTEENKQIEILRGINLTLENNKFVVITGPNGGGKSTLAKIIAGIEQPTAGEIILDGQDITGANITERARLGISFAFQQPVKFKGIEVFDLLRLASNRKLKFVEACEYLSEVGLCAGDYIHREVDGSLSGGELKRIEIATILARKTKFSIFDEPEAGIDLWSFKHLIQIFESMRRNISGSSIVVISHQERILNIADEIIVVADGTISRQGPRDQVLPELIGTPAAMGGCDKLQERG